MKAARISWRSHLLVITLLALATDAFAEQADFDREAQTKAHSGPNLRRVWVLSEPSAYGSNGQQREIVVYDVVCEEGKMTRVSERFEAASGPKFGEGWVLRAQVGFTAAEAKERLQRALADMCGI